LKIRQTIYYLFFLAITIGAFASMAHNNYGLKVISTSCFLISIYFLMGLLSGSKKLTTFHKLEQLGLTLLLTLFGLRAAYIHFPYVEWVVVFAAALLAVVYVKFALDQYRQMEEFNKLMARILLVYYLSVIGFLLSIVSRPFNTLISQAVGAVGGLLIGIIIVAILFKNKQMVNGEETGIIGHVRSRKDHSSLLVTGFFFISFYVGLNFLNVLPPLYTDEVPKAYIELVNKAETGRENAVDGKFQHDAYKEEWEKFLARHGLEE
jgi:hypothetical protein